MRATIAAVLVLAAAPFAGAEPAGPSGFVFEDLDADGVREPGEPGVAGVVVWYGADSAVTDASGRYALSGDEREAAAPRFVALTRPEGYDCPRWYRADGGDFALVPREPDGASYVFAHVSDVHISDRVADYAEHAVAESIAAMPRWLGGMAIRTMLRFQDPDYSAREVTRAVRAAIAPHRDVAGWSGPSVMGEWIRLIAGMGEPGAVVPIDPVGDFDAALAELRALSPRFVVSTGDLVLEANEADAASVDRWMRFYRERTSATGLRFYDTIGNNEIAGTGNEDFDPGDPGYGKALFRAHFGPTHYSFDRGGLHFVALDTHAQEGDADEDWRFDALEEPVRRWLDADLARHAGRAVVVLNHEPLGGDPDWSFAMRAAALVDSEVVDRLEAAGVRWTLAGHLHTNGLLERGDTQHITTGALSGFRWSLPPAAVGRGYRLVQVRDAELYSAWKPTGAPAFGFLDPAGDPRLHATAPRAVSEASRTRVVGIAVDAAGPFAAVEAWIESDGSEAWATSLPVEWWSPYFFAVPLGEVAGRDGVLVVEATREGGETLAIRTRLGAAAR